MVIFYSFIHILYILWLKLLFENLLHEHQISAMFKSQHIIRLCSGGARFKTCSRQSSSVAELHHRKLVEVSGPQSSNLLQVIFNLNIFIASKLLSTDLTKVCKFKVAQKVPFLKKCLLCTICRNFCNFIYRVYLPTTSTIYQEVILLCTLIF